MTPTKEEQLAAYINYLTDKFKMYNIFFQDFEAWKKRKYPTLPPTTTKTKTMNEIIEKYEARLEAVNRNYESKGPYLTRENLEVLNQIKIFLTEVVTDLRAIRALSK